MENPLNPRQINTIGTIQSVQSKNLVSGDKQVTIKVMIVGKEVEEANKFGNLAPGAMVIITHDPTIQIVS